MPVLLNNVQLVRQFNRVAARNQCVAALAPSALALLLASHRQQKAGKDSCFGNISVTTDFDTVLIPRLPRICHLSLMIDSLQI